MEINSEQEPVEKPVEEVHTGMNKKCDKDLKQNADLNTDDSLTVDGHVLYTWTGKRGSSILKLRGCSNAFPN